MGIVFVVDNHACSPEDACTTHSYDSYRIPVVKSSSYRLADNDFQYSELFAICPWSKAREIKPALMSQNRSLSIFLWLFSGDWQPHRGFQLFLLRVLSSLWLIEWYVWMLLRDQFESPWSVRIWRRISLRYRVLVTRIQFPPFATWVQCQILAFAFADHELPVLRFIEQFMIQAAKGEIEEAVSLNLNILH
jgi:hypothetical protein